MRIVDKKTWYFMLKVVDIRFDDKNSWQLKTMRYNMNGVEFIQFLWQKSII